MTFPDDPAAALLAVRRDRRHVQRLIDNVLKELAEKPPGTEARLVKLHAWRELRLVARTLRQAETCAEHALRQELAKVETFPIQSRDATSAWDDRNRSPSHRTAPSG